MLPPLVACPWMLFGLCMLVSTTIFSVACDLSLSLLIYFTMCAKSEVASFWGSFSKACQVWVVTTWIWSFPGLTILRKHQCLYFLAIASILFLLIVKKLFRFLVCEYLFFHLCLQHLLIWAFLSSICQVQFLSKLLHLLLSLSLKSSIDHFPLHILSILSIEEGQMEIVIMLNEPSKEQQ